MLRKIKNVPIVCPAEAINALRIIPNSHNIMMGRSHVNHDLSLKKVCILILINHDVVIPSSNLFPHLRIILKDGKPVYQKVVIVHQLMLSLVKLVFFKKPLNLRNEVYKVWILGSDNFF